MRIYKVYIYATAQEFYFQKRAGANKFIRDYYKESKDSLEKLTLRDFIEETGIEITSIPVRG